MYGRPLMSSSNPGVVSSTEKSLRNYSAEGFKEGGGVVGVRTKCYMADRLKLSNERLERTYTNHTSYTSPCLKPSPLGSVNQKLTSFVETWNGAILSLIGQCPITLEVSDRVKSLLIRCLYYFFLWVYGCKIKL